MPFHIINESTEKRYLTGSDFDPESFQFADDALWIGEEFGPYLIKADLNGKVLAVFDTQVDGKVVKSPDNPTLTLPGAPDGKQNFQVARPKALKAWPPAGRQQAVPAAGRGAVGRRAVRERRR